MPVQAFCFSPPQGGFNNASLDWTAGTVNNNVTGIIPYFFLQNSGIPDSNNNSNFYALANANAYTIVSGQNLSYTGYIWDVAGRIRNEPWDIGASQRQTLTYGTDSVRPDGISLYLKAALPSSGSIELSISGAWPDATLPLWIGTYDTIHTADTNGSGSFNLPLFIYGATVETGVHFNSCTLYMAGASGIETATMPLVIPGATDTAKIASMPLWIGTHYELEDTITQFNPPQNVPLYVRGGSLSAGTSGSDEGITLFIQSSASGALPMVWGDLGDSTMPLVIPNVIGFIPASSTAELFIQGIGVFSEPTSPNDEGSMVLYLHNPSELALAIPLYIQNDAVSSGINFYIRGKGFGQDDFIDNTNGEFIYATMPLFINREHDVFDINSGVELYIQGYTTDSSGIPFYMAGGLAVNSGLSLVLPSVYDATTQNVRLFTHGF